MNTNFQPVISKTAHGHYRQDPLEFKRALEALSLEPGASVARIAREHEVNANPIFSWRQLYLQGRLGVSALICADGLLPVVLASSVPAQNNSDADGGAGGTIVLELGDVRVRIEGQLNAAALVQVLDRYCDDRPTPCNVLGEGLRQEE